ncbi:hypothetical protein BIW11_11606 [Tropilaelaps mercedesae]|uniref:Ribosome-binding factor A n=1 Tax=Tropilaelaps mercedesae TaxID=418985 RepID=A0A1V9XAC0_9ACAR|nr:hypothetical protein BIW11_11606 [Tropilaelaps mercedesae]
MSAIPKINASPLAILRTFSTSCRIAAKPGYFLHKLIGREKNVELKIMKQEENKLLRVKRLPSEATRRQKVLNVLYMETITSVLASEFGNHLADLQVTVTEVRINRDLDGINVYWTAGFDLNTEEDKAQKIAYVLQELVPQIRAELSAVRHMGCIPKIRFVLYDNPSKEKQVGMILDKLRAAGDLENVEPAIIAEEHIPPVYGLDRDKIFQELQDKCRSADTDLSKRINVDMDLQVSVLKRLRLKKFDIRKNGPTLSTKAKGRWERQVYEEVFKNG